MSETKAVEAKPEKKGAAPAIEDPKKWTPSERAAAVLDEEAEEVATRIALRKRAQAAFRQNGSLVAAAEAAETIAVLSEIEAGKRLAAELLRAKKREK